MGSNVSKTSAMAGLCFVLAACATTGDGSGAKAGAANTACTHDEVLDMGAKLHKELDVGSPRWRTPMSETEKKAASDALIELMGASDTALRGDDAEACRRYRKLAAEWNIPLE